MYDKNNQDSSAVRCCCVQARLRGEHLPTLPQLVQSDIIRLTRWANRFREAMATHAAASAAAAGAEMLAAAAAAAPAAETGAAAHMASDLVPPAVGMDNLARTDDQADHGQVGGAADDQLTVSSAGPASSAAPALQLLSGADRSQAGDTGGMAAELQQVAEESQVK